MSDIGVYSAMETEIVNAIGTISGVNSVVRSMSLPMMLSRDFQTPVIGVIHSGTQFLTYYAVGSRRFRARVSFTVAFLDRDIRSDADDRPTIYTLLETVRDRVHYLQTSQSPLTRYVLSDESWQEVEEGYIGATQTYGIEVMLGN